MSKRLTAVQKVVVDDLERTHERAAMSETRVKAPRIEETEQREVMLAMADALEDILRDELRDSA